MFNKKILASHILAFFISVSILILEGNVAKAQDCRIVRIHTVTSGFTMSIELEPETVMMAPGGCVIWFNRGPTINVRISFREGQKCQEMTRAPSGFELDEARNCYVTQYIPLGGTASLAFPEKGSYSYEIETAEGMKRQGKIIVGESF